MNSVKEAIKLQRKENKMNEMNSVFGCFEACKILVIIDRGKIYLSWIHRIRRQKVSSSQWIPF